MSGAYIAKTLMLGTRGNCTGSMSVDADADDGVWLSWRTGPATLSQYIRPGDARCIAAALLAAADAAEAAKVPA